MSYGNDFNQSDSIFNNPALSEPQGGYMPAQPEKTPQKGLMAKFIGAVAEKLNEIDQQREEGKIKKVFEDALAGGEDIFPLFESFGCHFDMRNKNQIVLSCEKFKLSGLIYYNENQEMVLDDNAKQIVKYIIGIMSNTNNMENTIDKYEAEGFYPVGNLEQQTAIINGQQVEVMVGKLQNSAGEIKTIYYYNGQELFLSGDEEMGQ